jgi:hypothetical protein
MTLNEVIDGLRGIVRDSEDLTGQELVIGTEYVDMGNTNHRVPPGSIGIFLQQNTLNPDEPKYGTIVLTPGKTRILM